MKHHLTLSPQNFMSAKNDFIWLERKHARLGYETCLITSDSLGVMLRRGWNVKDMPVLNRAEAKTVPATDGGTLSPPRQSCSS